MKLFKTHSISVILGILMTLNLASCDKLDESFALEKEINQALIPEASFMASATIVGSGESITFTNTSTNNASLYSWSFPGGNPSSSTEANPTILYEGAGVFPVSLKVRNEYGAAEVTVENYIEVTAPPVIDIDTKAEIRYTFDGSTLKSDLDKGTLDITATSTAPAYSLRPGGGESYVCNGTNPLTIPGYKGINGAGARTVALWMKSSNSAGITTLVHWGANGTLSRSSFRLQPTGVIRFEYQGNGYNGVAVINDDTWHHVAYTYDGAGSVKLYVDGVQDFTTSTVPPLTTGSAGQTDVEIGSQISGAVFRGELDDVRIFNQALPAADILTLSNIK